MTIATPERLTLSVAEAARAIGVSRANAYNLIHAGELPSIRLGGRILVPRRALEERIARLAESSR
jgi:excisionase family DNA binding protein